MNDKSRKTVLRMLSYGVYVLTSKIDQQLSAATVTWVSQASFEPLMISVCIKRESFSYKVVKERGGFNLHVLAESQKQMAASFFKPSNVEGGLLNGHGFKIVDDLPLLTDIPAYLNCSVIEILEQGDHPLFLAEVNDAIVLKESSPLELRKTGWSYGG